MGRLLERGAYSREGANSNKYSINELSKVRQLSVKPCSVNFLTMHHHDSVFEKLRFRATTLKRIDAFSNVSGFRSVFKCLRFRKRRPPFSIVAVWSRGENVSKTMRFQMKTH